MLGVRRSRSFHGASPAPIGRVHPPGGPVLYAAAVFFVIALVAAVLGFGGIAAGAVGIAKILFVVFLVLALGSFAFGTLRRDR